MQLPLNLFFTGVPGSRWSGIASALMQLNGMNISDQSPERTYLRTDPEAFGGHQGVYFGKQMEYEPLLDQTHIDQAWTESGGCKLVKSHDWADMLDDVKLQFPDDWIMLVYRPDAQCLTWWNKGGGFAINYPNYSAYENQDKMVVDIARTNNAMLKFANKHQLSWNYFNTKWIKDNFDQDVVTDLNWSDVLVTILK